MSTHRGPGRADHPMPSMLAMCWVARCRASSGGDLARCDRLTSASRGSARQHAPCVRSFPGLRTTSQRMSAPGPTADSCNAGRTALAVPSLLPCPEFLRAGFLPADYAALHCARLGGVTAQLITVTPEDQRQAKPLVGPSSSERESFAAARPHRRSPKGLASVWCRTGGWRRRHLPIRPALCSPAIGRKGS